jgi:SH3-like domain-containing protein
MNRRAKGAALIFASIAGLAMSAAAQPQPAPAPHYMAIRSERTEARSGPGQTHAVEWIYRRKGLPMRVLGRDGAWLRVEDPGGAQSWMHRSGLEERRTVFVTGGRLGSVTLRRTAQADGRAVVHLERGVVAELDACRGAWRRVIAGGYAGWARADAFWGADSCG